MKASSSTGKGNQYKPWGHESDHASVQLAHGLKVLMEVRTWEVNGWLEFEIHWKLDDSCVVVKKRRVKQDEGRFLFIDFSNVHS